MAKDAPKKCHEPPRSAVAGLAFAPQAQLALYSANKLPLQSLSDIDWTTILPANPMRILFTVQVLGGGKGASSGLSIRPGDESGSPGPITAIGGLPARFHVAEWPVLCQGSWVAIAADFGTQIEVWEVVARQKI